MQSPRQLERQYNARLKRLVSELAAEVREAVVNALPDLLAQRERELGYNADSFSQNLELLLASIDVLKRRKQDEAIFFLPLLAKKVEGFNQLQHNKAAKAVLGRDIFKGDATLAPLVESWTAENVALIKDLSNGYLTKVEGIVQRGVRGGIGTKTIAADIQAATGVSTRRATLIARDQVSKLNGAITQHRQRKNGIQYYIWSTSGDERVRDSHILMDGLLCRWDDPTVYSPDNGRTWVARAGEMLHPQEAVQCRCVANPVFPEELDG